jgi:hypothetical protein
MNNHCKKNVKFREKGFLKYLCFQINYVYDFILFATYFYCG